MEHHYSLNFNRTITIHSSTDDKKKNFRFLMNFSMSCSVIHRQLLMHNVRFYVVIFLQLHVNVIYRI